MIKNFVFGLASLSLAVVPTAAFAATHTFNLRLQVPVHCTVKQQGIGTGVALGNTVTLGTFREYCNAPGGYELVVSYAPGSLQGARIIAGNDEIILDGSGRAVLSRATGPKSRERLISLSPGANGFDTDRLELDIIPG
jgi:hypothetical protein